MLTREVLDRAIEQARNELQIAPPDGVLAYIADKVHKTITADENFALVVAQAYKIATEMERGRG